MKKKSYPVINIGTISILTVFIVLCMVTFATLTYVSAARNARFNTQITDRTTAYYTACATASEKLAVIDRTLSAAWNEGTFEEQPEIFSFSVDIDEEKQLNVIVDRMPPDENNGHLYTIRTFKETAINEWKGDTSLNLMQIED